VGICTQHGGMGKRDGDVPSRAEHTVGLSEHTVKVCGERQCRNRQYEVDLVGSHESEFGRLSLVKLDSHLTTGGEGSSQVDLAYVSVDRRHSGAPNGQADRGVSCSAAELEDLAAADFSQQSSVDLGARARAELHEVERAIGVRTTSVVNDHGASLAVPCPEGVEAVTTTYVPTIVAMIPDRTGRVGRRAAPVDYRLAREATLQAWREGELTSAQICDAQSELRRNAEFCGVETKRECPVCELSRLVEVTYVFGPRLPKAGRCVTTAREMERIEERSGTFKLYVVEVCNSCGWNHLTRSNVLGPA